MTTTAVAYRPAFADTRVPGKPSPDSNDKAGWPEFQFTLKTYGRAASAEKKCRALRGAQQTYEDKEGEREKQPAKSVVLCARGKKGGAAYIPRPSWG
ncbi:unnamed protein product [Prorocentrum cordatum]|uniref:Uncharacterized protein n=1 Tax=Prorocentrum cordatum TaxID=2364126 RepID=A0ABN9V2K6_9DINO|nr:unnamed protein product [Polarella glacialis]